MLQYYASIINVEQNSMIYTNFVDDRKKNNYYQMESLKSQVTHPPIPCEEHKCTICRILEDESHVIYTCP